MKPCLAIIPLFLIAACAVQPEPIADASDPRASVFVTVGEEEVIEPEPASSETAPENAASSEVEADAESVSDDEQPLADDQPPELLHLWGEDGHFLQGKWESLSHKERQAAVETLAERGNRSARLAKNDIDNGKLDEDQLKKAGTGIAGGSYGWWSEHKEDRMGQGGGRIVPRRP